MGRVIAFVIQFVAGSFGGFQRDGKLSVELSAALKGIASIMIVLTHTAVYSENGIVRSLGTGWICVALFFFLSGYGSAYSLSRQADHVKCFLRNRFVHVGVPLAAAYVIYVVYRLLAYGEFHLDTPDRFLRGTLTIPYSWYPFSALCFYVLIWVAFRFAKRRVCRAGLLSVLVILYTFVLWRIFGNEDGHWYISNFAFVFGAALQLYDPQLRYRKFTLPAAAVCAVGGFGIQPVCNRLFGDYVYPAYILSCNLGSGFLVLALILLVTVTGNSNRVTAFLGKISYEIYLYHGLFILILTDLLHLQNWWQLFIFSTAAAIPFAALMHKPDAFLCGKLCKRPTVTETSQARTP